MIDGEDGWIPSTQKDPVEENQSEDPETLAFPSF